MKATSRSPRASGLSKAKSSTGFVLSEGDRGRSKVRVIVPCSSSSDTCTKRTKPNNLQSEERKIARMRFRLLPAAGCRTSKLLFLLARSNESEADEWADCEQNPNRTKLLFVSSPLSPTPSRNAAKMSSTKHGAA